jgi:hypothetical protein
MIFLLAQEEGLQQDHLFLYLIGVTNVDPVKYNLFFESFVSKSRAKKNRIKME